MKKIKERKKIGLHPVMTFIILCLTVIFISFILSLFNTQSTYSVFSSISRDYKLTTESITSLFNLSGIKYIFTNTVSNFANFTVLSNLIIILIGVGVMDKSGFLQTAVTLLTKKAKKTSVTFVIVFLCIISSIIGDLSYIIFIPLVALFFYYGKRNPFIGIIASFGALTAGSGLSLIFTAIDSNLRNTTLLNASVLDVKYTFGIHSLAIINLIVIIAASYIITKITEEYVAKKVPKYEFPESALEEDIVTKKELKGILYASFVGIIYLLIIIYNIIPGLPASGNLLDYSQTLYIDKLFSYESFFTNGYVFIIALLFILVGLFYGIGSKSINNNKDLAESLGFSLDGIGKILILIFAASIFISIFKQTNIGTTFVVALSNLLTYSNFTGLPLVLLLFFISILSTIFVPYSIIKWPIIASSAVPLFMNTGLSPEFAQVIFRLGESVSMGLTPLLAYFVVYLAYIEKYNQDEKTINLFTTIKYQLPYAIAMFFLFLIVIVIWYLTNFPLGFGGHVTL